MKRIHASVLILLFLAACSTTVPQSSEPVRVVIVGTTDVHGWFNGREERGRDIAAGARYGGVATLASYIDALRAENGGRVMVVDSGDMFQGTLESNMAEGEPVVLAYNVAGYAAAAIGNHEFDYGPIGPDVIADTPSEDPLGVLKRNAKLAKFPFLSANLIDNATGATPAWAKKSTIVDAGGVRIGIIGLSTPDTPLRTIPANVKTLTFTDPVEATLATAQTLRAAGVDAVVVIAHIGGRCRNQHDVNDLASCEMNQDAITYLQSLPPGTIDAYFAGHTHAQMRHFVNGIPATQGLAFSQEFSAIDLWIDRKAKRVVRERTDIRPLTMICSQVYAGTDRCDPRNAPAGAVLVPRIFAGRTIIPDARIEALTKPYLDRVAAKKNEKLGLTVLAPFTRIYQRESELGNLLTDALRDFTRAEIAFFNSGGIRANLRAGDLVYADIFEVSPFDNYPAVVMMTGAQITEALRASSTGGSGVLQVSGLRYVIDEARDADKPETERNRLVSATLENGEPLEPARLYKVAMLDFLVVGGDGLSSAMKDITPDRIMIYQNRPVRDAIIEALQKRGRPLQPKIEGRITVLNAPQPSRRD
ncbi:MAG: 5'-nucleotidase C-terminal domain-containing protein [Thermoanaerobaculia bacterium]|nr:5'-nucleotidase C-terminal domain-containing protein [Thermoanaerobaculia bacterium]